MSLTDNDIKLIVGASAAVSALSVAFLSAALARIFAQRDRRRQMYGEAFRTALAWHEMVYRVRRRDNTDEHDRVLVDKFHELQERLDYYEGWIGSESKYMRRSYRKLVNAEKSSTASDLNVAWDKPGKKGNADSEDNHPAVERAIRDGYLRDVRGHLSLQPWRWLFVAFRNWSEP
ncbi:hypothetical protein MMAG44476_18142 [Mycolicibacterium mageritense DSM 44476 = CIP 104973]|uniref:SLATT domain-containing protein n=1 Tax=Mycolicibacterium mageritense TaxID=53462 RepID=A0ABM7HMI3_MYCME|nr:hypothetical protein [Mycolicibacterium mageritense]MBN3455353.1 hypothetical protein [Mycobacterium sp. DSM 3803]OKH64909.1 hypothetical protein EB73_22610 [Mycobacterium sp. SWH-M3]MCC9180175.1 hypothetical protein [Mycolicibacterium mageritense]CDO23730.1 hypothetical protein BN978_04218 [Mycolicibacterium mageritense DSM 44476 = CIP 104973]BBX31722.1 hypothetical protein MMAGJ_10040 [Mycolicibacterium mageritense]